ncbi:hypothetical protein [Grimontia celer]|uniref:hypothetical protein n=1 Tax=Grimontia celer TaxID=1796497 RepID=UPI001E2C4D8D|nr:hypothetical protein [Grimontia celer]
MHFTVDSEGGKTEYRYKDNGLQWQVIQHVDDITLTTEYGYDSQNRIIWRNSEGRVTTVRYDSHNREIHTELGGVATTYRYDANGKVLRSVEGEVIAATDTAAARVLEERVTEYGYDAQQNLTHKVVKSGADWDQTQSVRTTEYRYNGAGQVTEKITGNGAVTRYTYDGRGRVVHEVNALNYVTEYDYDVNDRVTQTTRYAHAIEAPRTWTAFLTGKEAEKVADSTKDRVTKTQYDKDGRITYEIDGAGYATGYTYNANGQVLTTTQYHKPTTEAGWNQASAANRTTHSLYDGKGQLRFTVSPNGQVSERRYDGEGRVTQTLRYGETVSLTAALTDTNALSEHLKTQLANETVRSEMTVYDTLGRKRFTLDGDGYLIEYQYNRHSEVATKKEYVNNSAIKNAIISVRNGDSVLSDYGVFQQALDTLGGIEDAAEYLQERLNEVNEQQARIDSLNADILALEQDIAATDAENHTLGIDINDAANRIDSLYLEVREEAAYQETLKQDILALRQEIAEKENALRAEYSEELAAARAAVGVANNAYEAALSHKAVTEAAVQALVGESVITELLPDMTDDFALPSGVLGQSTTSDMAAQAALSLLNTAESQLVTAINAIRFEGVTDEAELASLNAQLANLQAAVARVFQTEQAIRNDMAARYTVTYTQANQTQTQTTLADVQARQAYMEAQIAEHAFTALGEPADVQKAPLSVSHEIADARTEAELQAAIEQAQVDYETAIALAQEKNRSVTGFIQGMYGSITQSFNAATDEFLPNLYVPYQYYSVPYLHSAHALFDWELDRHSNHFNIYGYSEHFEQALNDALSPGGLESVKAQQTTLQHHLAHVRYISYTTSSVAGMLDVQKSLTQTLTQLDALLSDPSEWFLTQEEATALWEAREQEVNAPSAESAYNAAMYQAERDAIVFRTYIKSALSDMAMLADRLTTYYDALLDRDEAKQTLETLKNTLSTRQSESVTTALREALRATALELQQNAADIAVQQDLLTIDPDNSEALAKLVQLEAKETELLTTQSALMVELDATDSVQDVVTSIAINSLDDAVRVKVDAEKDILANKAKIATLKGEVATLSEKIDEQLVDLAERRSAYDAQLQAVQDADTALKNTQSTLATQQQALETHILNVGNAQAAVAQLSANKQSALDDQSSAQQTLQLETQKLDSANELLSIHEPVLTQEGVLDEEANAEELSEAITDLGAATTQEGNARTALRNYLTSGVKGASQTYHVTDTYKALNLSPKMNDRLASGQFGHTTERMHQWVVGLISPQFPQITNMPIKIIETGFIVGDFINSVDLAPAFSEVKKYKDVLNGLIQLFQSLPAYNYRNLPTTLYPMDYFSAVYGAVFNGGFASIHSGFADHIVNTIAIDYYNFYLDIQNWANEGIKELNLLEGYLVAINNAVTNKNTLQATVNRLTEVDVAYDKVTEANAAKEAAKTAIANANAAISDSRAALLLIDQDIADAEAALTAARSAREAGEAAVASTRVTLAQAEVDKANAEKLLLQARSQLNVAADNYNEAQSALLLATDSLDSAYDNLGVALDLHRQADMYIRQAEVSKDEAKATLAEAQELVSLAHFSVYRKANADIASHDTSYEYDDRGQLKTELSALVSFGEHTDAGVQQYIGRLAIEHTYDSLGNVRTTTTAANTNQASTKAFEYDVQGNQTRAVGLGGGSVIYNNQNLAAVNINALGHRRDRVYDDEGRLRYEVDELGFVTEHRYDGLNQKTTQLRYANAYTASRPEGEPLTLAALDAFISEGEGGDYRALDYRYSTRGELETTTTSSSVDSQTRTNGVHHNAFGDKTSTFTTYVDEQGESLTVTNQQHLYNAAGQLMASQDAEGYVTVYAYNGYGELSSQREIKARYVDSNNNPLVWDRTSVEAWAETQQGAARERRTDFAYDARGNRQQVTQVDVEYAQHGGTTVEQVRGDLITTTYHDHAGRQFMTVQEAAPSDPASHLIAENRTLQSYDALGRLVSSWSKRKDYVVSGLQLSLEGVIPDRLQKHQLTSYRYDAQGNLMATESDGRTTYQYYDADGKLTRRVDAEGNVTHVEMDDMNRTQAEWRHVSAPGYQYQQRTEYNYDATGRQTGTTVVVNGGDNIREEAHYNAFGEVEAKTHNGVVQEAYVYDGLGRVDTKTMHGSQHNVITTYQYNWLDKVTVETLGGNRTTTRAYDLKGNLTGEKGPWFDGKQSVTTQTFDRWGNVLKQTMNGNTYDFVYNHANQVILQTSPLENKTIVDATGQVDTDARPQTRMFYDQHGNRIAVQDANGHWQWSGYDLTGQKLWDKNGQGGITRYYHNIHGEMVGRINTDGQGEVYRYNNNGQLLTRSKIDNAKELIVLEEGNDVYYHETDDGSPGYLEVYAQYAYDQAGQRYHEQWFGGSGYEIYTRFDAAGRVLETKGAGQHKRYTYDSFGNKEAEIWLDGGIEQARKTSAYDAFGKLSTETLYDGSVVTHHYDRYGQLDKKTGAISIDYDYWENGLLKSQTTGTKTESYQYNVDGKETRRVLSDGATALVTHTEWDNLGRIERIRNEAVSAFGQSLNASTVAYRYDAVGNRRKITTTGEQNSTRWYHYDKDNRMVGSHTRAHDVGTNSIGNHAGDRTITYTATGQKKDETRWENKTRDGHTALVETVDVFDYDSNGHLTWVESAEVVQGQSYVVRRVSMENHKTGHAELQRDTVYTYAYVNGQVSGNATESKTTVMDFAYQDGRLSWQEVKENGDPSTTTHFYYHFNGQLREQRNVIYGEDRGVDKYTYTYRAKDLQKATITADSTRRGNGSGFRAGTTTHHYNNTGQLTGITSTRNESERKHLTDFNGQIALQLDVDKNTLLANLTTSGNPLATITKGKVDADLLDDSGSSAGQQPGTYTVGANDTLQRIAQLVYGDSRYWYLIADANGLSPTEPLTEGKLLVIPNQHTQTFNGAESFKPYNESEVLGNVNPDPIALPPPKKSCNPIAMIVMVVVAVVVTIYTAGAAATLFAGGGLTAGGVGAAGVGALGGVAAGGAVVTTAAGVTTSLGALGLAGAAAIGGAVGSAASQLVGKGLGVVDDFSWEQVALGGLTAAAASGIGGALGEYGVFNANPDAANLAWRQAGNAAVSSATSYGGNYLGSKLLGEDFSFSWTNLAASAVGSVVSVGSAQLTKGLNVVGDTIDNFVSSATASALRGESFRRNAGNILTDAFGNALATAATSGAREAYDIERSAAFEREKLRKSIDENSIRLLKTVDFKQREEQPGRILLANVNTPEAPKGVVPSPARVQADALLYTAEQQRAVWDELEHMLGDEEFANIGGYKEFGDYIYDDLLTSALTKQTLRDLQIADITVIPDHGGLGDSLGVLYDRVYDLEGNQYAGIDNDTANAFTDGFIQAQDTHNLRTTGYRMAGVDYAIGGVAGRLLGIGLTGLGTLGKYGAARFSGGVSSSNLPSQRPSWRQSEIDVTAPLELQGFRTQVSFKDGVEVPYGTKGSTRPEAYTEGLSVEVKNYNVETSQGRSNLVRNVSNQAQHRAQNLPANTTQQVNIDVRGQNVSRTELNQMIERMVERSNGALRAEDINILR